MPHSKPGASGGSDSLGLNESLWCCLEMAGPERQCARAGAATKGFDRAGEAVLLVSFWLDLVHREDAEGRFLVCVYQAGMRRPV